VVASVANFWTKKKPDLEAGLLANALSSWKVKSRFAIALTSQIE